MSAACPRRRAAPSRAACSFVLVSILPPPRLGRDVSLHDCSFASVSPGFHSQEQPARIAVYEATRLVRRSDFESFRNRSGTRLPIRWCPAIRSHGASDTSSRTSGRERNESAEPAPRGCRPAMRRSAQSLGEAAASAAGKLRSPAATYEKPRSHFGSANATHVLPDAAPLLPPPAAINTY